MIYEVGNTVGFVDDNGVTGRVLSQEINRLDVYNWYQVEVDPGKASKYTRWYVELDLKEVV